LVEAIWQYRVAFEQTPPNASRPAELAGRHLLFALSVGVVMLPTFVSRWIVYGGPFKTGYLSIRDFLWSSPVAWKVLFSPDHGLLSWTPILILSIVGLGIFARRLPRVGIPFLVATLCFYVFFALYPDWDGISSYGNRFFVSLTPLFIAGLAVMLESCAKRFARQTVAVAVSSAVVSCFVLWNLGLIYQWGTHLIPARGPISFRKAAYNQFAVVPGELSSHLQSYFFRRSDLMKQIEQKDREQLREGDEE